ncbi:MAG TPA: tetratricopeptide repeat protein, partial [Thermoanaerobaculia bacterium]|nr:tetratricopeptide repeat protein [Thermoanaerobaculia bacterium]
AKTSEAAKIDLAAALIVRGGRADLERALKLSETSDAPAALWNRAAAYRQMQSYDEAIEAYNDYLQVDSTSAYAKEAAAEIKQLEELRNLTRVTN